MDLPLKVELKGQDCLEVTSLVPFKMTITGCALLHQRLNEIKKAQGADVAKWTLVNEKDHVALLINELILKLQDKWQHPYLHEEVCHCRTITLETVEQAIMAGAHTPEMVSKWTTASTACGTCRPDVEKILAFRLGQGAP